MSTILCSLNSGGAALKKLSGGVLTELIVISQTIFAGYNLLIVLLLLCDSADA